MIRFVIVLTTTLQVSNAPAPEVVRHPTPHPSLDACVLAAKEWAEEAKKRADLRKNGGSLKWSCDPEEVTNPEDSPLRGRSSERGSAAQHPVISLHVRLQ